MIYNKTTLFSKISTLPVSPEITSCGTVCKQTAVQAAQVKAGSGSQVFDFFKKLFDTADWPPRWHCGNWSDFHGWLYIISDLTIWASYFAIPILLVRMLRGRSDIPFPKIILLFVAFIVLCGTTHLLDAIIFWWPLYRLSALVRFFTAVVSATAVYALYRIMPHIFSLRSVTELEREINERKLLEEKLYLSHQQLKTFTYILSHNIRNHTSNIALLTDLVDHQTLDENNSDLFGKIVKVSRGLNDTLNDLSAAIKIRETLIESELLSFKTSAGNVIEILDSEIVLTGTVIKFDFEVENVMFPKIYLESILLNLISNSVKYRRTDLEPVIHLKTFYNESGRTVLTCADNGTGIDLDLNGAKVFGLYKTFHQNDDAHGVGLFLVKTQVESHGGAISVTSKPGEGTVFTIIFN